ncbi:MAG: hypothetical protein ACUVQP_06630 [Bacteroidales bacterium]
MKEIREMSDEVLIKTLKEIREEIERRRAEVWEKYTGVKYPLKRNLRKKAGCGER